MARDSNARIWTAGVGALAVAVHLGVWLGGAADPSFGESLVDARTYHELAVGLAQHGVLDEHFLYQAPFFPLFLALVYKALGTAPWVVHLLQIGLGAGTCMLTAGLGRRVVGSSGGLLAGAVLALCGPFVFFNLQLLAAGWAAFWMVVLAHLVLDARRNEIPLPRVALLGGVGAMALLTRPTFGLLLVFILFLLARRPQGPRRLAALLVGLVLVLAPYGLVMRALTGHEGILPPSGAINLHIGNNAEFVRTINIRVGRPWENLVAEPGRHGQGQDPWAGQGYFRDQVLRFWREDPGAGAALFLRKGTHLVSSRELPRNLDIYIHREWSPLLGVLVWKLGSWGFPLGLLLPLAVLGWGPGSQREGRVLAGLTVVYGASLVLVFVAARYRVALLPLVAVAAVQGALWLRACWGSLAPGRRVAVGAAMLLVVGMSTLPGPFAQEEGDLRGELFYGVGYNAYQVQDWNRAEGYFRQAVTLDPDLVEAHHFLALTLVRQGAWDEACAEFNRTVALAPDYAEAARNLERCRQRRAERDFRRARDLEEDDPAQALALYEGIFAEQPRWLEGRVRLAWMLATVQDKSLRDPERARRLLSVPAVQEMRDNPYIRQVLKAAGL